MQATILVCPNCGSAVRPARPVAAGTPVRCRACSHVFKAPPPDDSDVPVAQALPASWRDRQTAAPKRATPLGNDEVIDLRSLRVDSGVRRPRLADDPAPRPTNDDELSDENLPFALAADEDVEEPERPRRKKKKKKKKKEVRNEGVGPQLASVGAGLAMMLGAVIWFVVGLGFGYIFFYPPVLFVLGIIAVVRGAAGQEP